MATALQRIIKQVTQLRKSEEDWFILPDEGDDEVNYLSFSVEIEAPDHYVANPAGEGQRELPYKGGLFRVQLTFGEAYPNEPPSVKFTTRIWHPQIQLPEGKPCVDVLTKEWKPTMTVKDVLLILRQLIGNPTKEDSVNAEAAAELHRGIEEFEKHARAETQKWACDA